MASGTKRARTSEQARHPTPDKVFCSRYAKPRDLTKEMKKEIIKKLGPKPQTYVNDQLSYVSRQILELNHPTPCYMAPEGRVKDSMRFLALVSTCIMSRSYCVCRQVVGH